MCHVRFFISCMAKRPHVIYLAERATKTFVGTAQYVSPELLEANETSKRYTTSIRLIPYADVLCESVRTCGHWVVCYTK